MNTDKIKELIKKNIIGIGGILVAIASILGSYFYIKANECEICEECPNNISLTNNNIVEEDDENTNKIKIDVKGGVKKPGVYELEDGSIVNDAIKAAGGLTTSGVTSNINLSKKLKDEMVVYVFTKKELTTTKSTNKVVCEIPKCECEQIVVNKEIETSVNSEEVKVDSNTTSTSTDKISINTDSITELMRLSGIGEAKAKAIIEYRKSNGNFISIEDIKKVSGISESIYNKIKDYITV